MEIDDTYTEISSKHQYLITLFSIQFSLWSSHTDDMDPRLSDERVEIVRIVAIILIEVY